MALARTAPAKQAAAPSPGGETSGAVAVRPSDLYPQRRLLPSLAVHLRVGAGTAAAIIVIGPAVEVVGAVAAFELIIAVAAVDRVAPAAAFDLIFPIITIECVAAGVAFDLIIAFASADGVVTAAALELVVS